jgi:glycerate kinase
MYKGSNGRWRRRYCRSFSYGYRRKTCRNICNSPIGKEKVKATYGLLGDGSKAIIEMASASGIQLVKKRRKKSFNSYNLWNRGTNIRCIKNGAKHILIGIGGSATNDGGAGMIQALGGHLLDDKGNELHFGGALYQSLIR